MDPILLALLKSKRLELDHKQTAVRLKRCRKGQPPNPKWEQTWAAYKQAVLQKVVAEYKQARNTAGMYHVCLPENRALVLSAPFTQD